MEAPDVVLVSLLAHSGLRQFLATESPLKVLKKCFLFHLKSFFHSQNIEDYGFTFWSCIKMP